MHVRHRTPDLDPEWLRMRLALWPDESPAQHRPGMAEWLQRPDAIVLVAGREGGGLTGFAEVGTRPCADGCATSPVGYLEGWYVDPEVRRRGGGRALVGAALARARARGLREFASDVRLDNRPSQAAHRALGFEEVERAVRCRMAI